MRDTEYLPALEELYMSLPSFGRSPLDDPMIPWDEGIDVAGPFMGIWKAGKKKGEGVYQRGNVGGVTKSSATVVDPQRIRYPGIYKDPRDIALEAAISARTAPEDPLLRQLWGVTRDDLYEMNKGRIGNEAPNIVMPNRRRGSAAASKVMNPRNTQRILDTLSEAEKYPELYKGMDAWYEMGPLFDRYKQITDNPIDEFKEFQTFTGLASPGSEVLSEINRGTAARYLHKQGRMQDFMDFGGKANNPTAPVDLEGLMGHPYHKTSQSPGMMRYSETGNPNQKSPKVPLYIQSAGVERTGFQNQLPVGDAHFSRAVGLADTRTSKDTGGSISTPELLTIEDWWRDYIAGPLGISPVNAQGRAWGTFAGQTGVDSPVGATKLELITRKIMDAAKVYDVSPEYARDAILMGEMFAPNVNLMKRK